MDWGVNQIRWAKRLDALITVALSRLSAPQAGAGELPDPASVRRILFVKLWGIGSIVLTEPALRFLSQRYANAEIDYLTSRANAGLLRLFPKVSEVHTVPAAHLPGLLWQGFGTAKRLRRRRYDLVFDAEFLVAFSGWLCRLVGAGQVVGFRPPRGGKCCWQDVSIGYRADGHAVDQFLNLAQMGRAPEGLSRGLSGPAPGSSPGRSGRRPVLRLPPAQRVIVPRPYLVLNVNASPLALERRWPRDRFVQLSRRLLREFGLHLVLIGTNRERDYVGWVAERLAPRQRVWDLSGCLNLAQLANLIDGATLLISNDSGPVHLASAFDVPVVAFYGPESPGRYGPLSSRQLVFYQGLWCSPCMSVENAKTVRCCNGQRCMKEITAETVIEQVARFLRRLLEAPIPEAPARWGASRA